MNRFLLSIFLLAIFLLAALMPAVCSAASVSAASDADASDMTADDFPRYEFLPKEELFTALLGDPRESQFVLRRADYRLNNRYFDAGTMSLGDAMPFVSATLADGDTLQFGIDAGLFGLFDLDTDSWDLQSTDFTFAFALSYRHHDFSSRLRFFHLSSHLGDEYILNNTKAERQNFSTENLQLILSQEWRELRFYAGGGGIVRSTDPIDPWNMQAGMEFRKNVFFPVLQAVAVSDLQSRERDGWNLRQSYGGGFALVGEEHRELRLMAEYYRGSALEGQFTHQKAEYYGIALYFSP